MKYLIVGLGNVGAEYRDTRHNVGFEVVDELAHQKEQEWKSVSHGELATIKHKGRSLLLLKPNTYMNRSGVAVRHWMTKENIPQDRVLIVVDDIHLDLGTRRLRNKGSDGGHNGLKSVEEKLGNASYPRLRLGVGNDFHPGRQVEYVLGKWDAQELESKDAMVEAAAKCVLAFGSLEFKYAVQSCNGNR